MAGCMDTIILARFPETYTNAFIDTQARSMYSRRRCSFDVMLLALLGTAASFRLPLPKPHHVPG